MVQLPFPLDMFKVNLETNQVYRVTDSGDHEVSYLSKSRDGGVFVYTGYVKCRTPKAPLYVSYHHPVADKILQIPIHDLVLRAMAVGAGVYDVLETYRKTKGIEFRYINVHKYSLAAINDIALPGDLSLSSFIRELTLTLSVS